MGAPDNHHDAYFLNGYLLWLLLSIIPATIGSFLSAYIEPSSGGSGIVDVKCYLNGIKVPNVAKLGVLFVKMVGCLCTYLGDLTGGKVGSCY